MSQKYNLRGKTQEKDTPIDLEKTITLMGKRKDDLISRLDSGEGFDSVTVDLTRSLLQAVIDIIPSVEAAAKLSTRGVYPLVNLTNIVRELSHDLRSMQDRDAMREKIMNGIIDPSLLIFAQTQIIALNQLQRRVRDPENQDFIVNLRARIADTVNEMRIKISDSLDAYFGGSGGAKNLITSEHTDEEESMFEDEEQPVEPKKQIRKKKGYRYGKRR